MLRTPIDIRAAVFVGMDLVMNEVGETAMTIGFHWLDKHAQKRIERHVDNRVVIGAIRILTIPTQSFANIVRFANLGSATIAIEGSQGADGAG